MIRFPFDLVYDSKGAMSCPTVRSAYKVSSPAHIPIFSTTSHLSASLEFAMLTVIEMKSNGCLDCSSGRTSSCHRSEGVDQQVFDIHESKKVPSYVRCRARMIICTFRLTAVDSRTPGSPLTRQSGLTVSSGDRTNHIASRLSILNAKFDSLW